MQLVPGSERIVAGTNCDPTEGRVRWAPAKSLWIGSMSLTALILGPVYFTWGAFALFIATCAITLCAGHSVGMHRRLIHNSFACPRWLENVCVYLGVLVGMAGPIGMIRLHDMRDWAQRQRACHDYFAHRAGFWRDGWHQLHCQARSHPPARVSPRAAPCSRSCLCLDGADLDGAAASLGYPVLRRRRTALVGLGSFRSRRCLRDWPLARRALRASRGRPDLGGQRRVRSGVRRKVSRPDQHG
jgi:hypothetical protein